MPMQLIETSISEKSVMMRLANDAAKENATELLEFVVPLEPLMLDERNPLGNPGKRHLASVQRAALRYVQDAIYEEMQRLSALTPR